MMKFDRAALGRQAQELGFVRDTYEKVCRLADVLAFLEEDSLLSASLALKGGTAINLTIFNLPRLSVDIDLDYADNASRADMLEARKIITDRIGKYMAAGGYSLSPKTRRYHALDSFIYAYQNTGGMNDNIKIEINYMLRCHVLPLSRRILQLPDSSVETTVLSVDPVEVFGAKSVALLSRAAPRDLYDLHQMLRYGLIDASQEPMLKKCIVFYSAIASDTVPEAFTYDRINTITQHKIRTDLVPVIRKKEQFDLPSAQRQVKEYLTGLLALDETEKQFLDAFRQKNYRPELLFPDGAVLERIEQHPMALWKCREKEQKKQIDDREL